MKNFPKVSKSTRPLATPGSHYWKYQPAKGLYERLGREIRTQWQYFLNDAVDKINMPLYFFFSGAGTGKSRNAVEFHASTISCLEEKDVDLKRDLVNS
jgi:hypothetical protein